MSTPSERHSPKTSDKLRHAIDRGHGGDKVAYPDPAAAPLGTDDEAAGTPPSPERLDITFASEMRRPANYRRDRIGWVPAIVGALAFLTLIVIALAAVTA